MFAMLFKSVEDESVALEILLIKPKKNGWKDRLVRKHARHDRRKEREQNSLMIIAKRNVGLYTVIKESSREEGWNKFGALFILHNRPV